MRKQLVAALALALVACDGASPPGGQKAEAAGGAPRVVVAILDSAFNPYHEFLYAGSPIYAAAAPAAVTPEVLAEFDIPPERQVQLTRTGDLAADIATDLAFWNGVERGKAYWFIGTNMIGISMCGDPLPPLVPHADKNPHGVATSAAALRANPETVLLAIEECATGTLEIQELAMLHPAIDIVSYSFGIGVGVAETPLPLSFHATYRGVVERGKLQFQAAGNSPGLTPLHAGSGNWWVIGVSGIDEDGSRGQPVLSSNVPDFVSDFIDELPYCMDCESGLTLVRGTSASSPRAAGVASRVLLEARRALGHQGGIVTAADGRPALLEAGGVTITNWDLRRALEEAAFVGYAMADFAPGGEDPLLDSALPVNDSAPWLQLGWGDISADPAKQVVAEALAQLGLGTPGRAKDAGFCEFMAANMRSRQAYWDAVGTARMQGELVPDPNPYRFCDSAVPVR